jgi:hypothetical protein
MVYSRAERVFTLKHYFTSKSFVKSLAMRILTRVYRIRPTGKEIRTRGSVYGSPRRQSTSAKLFCNLFPTTKRKISFILLYRYHQSLQMLLELRFKWNTLYLPLMRPLTPLCPIHWPTAPGAGTFPHYENEITEKWTWAYTILAAHLLPRGMLTRGTRRETHAHRYAVRYGSWWNECTSCAGRQAHRTIHC